MLDCDQHGGNGTAEFTRSLENLFNYTIFGMRYGCREYDRSINAWIPREQGSFVQYQRALEDAFGRILDWKTDLLVYQAGMDCHQLDPFGSAWFDSDSLYQRDLMVFEFAKQHGIPIVFVLAGGYQALPALTELHVSTFQAAQVVYFNLKSVSTNQMIV